jgi:hypothetical protein
MGRHDPLPLQRVERLASYKIVGYSNQPLPI